MGSVTGAVRRKSVASRFSPAVDIAMGPRPANSNPGSGVGLVDASGQNQASAKPTDFARSMTARIASGGLPTAATTRMLVAPSKSTCARRASAATWAATCSRNASARVGLAKLPNTAAPAARPSAAASDAMNAKAVDSRRMRTPGQTGEYTGFCHLPRKTVKAAAGRAGHEHSRTDFGTSRLWIRPIHSRNDSGTSRLSTEHYLPRTHPAFPASGLPVDCRDAYVSVHGPGCPGRDVKTAAT